MPPKSKKRRLNHAANGSAAGASAAQPPDRATWPGWSEIESEPAFFNVMLQEMGVNGAKVQEVLGLDEELLAILPKPVYALIFLFRYRETDKDKQEESCPDHVWFANQIPEFACGTVALLNIVNNVPDLNIGPHLQSFKDFTTDFDPTSRGDAITSFDFVRRIHNSFAREQDMYNVDMHLKKGHANAAKAKKTVAAREAKAAKAAEKAAEAAKHEQVASESTPIRKSARASKPRKMNDGIVPLKDEEDEGFHFISYLPINGEVWKLDGLDRFPQNLGTYSDGDWLDIAVPVLQARMAQYQEGQIEFSLMAVVKDPIIGAKSELAENMKALQYVERALDEANPDWKTFLVEEPDTALLRHMSLEYGLSIKDTESAELPKSIKDQLQTTCSEDLVRLRQHIITSQAGCRAAVRDQMEAEKADTTKAMHRRHDYGQFLRDWLDALAENDALTPLIADSKK